MEEFCRLRVFRHDEKADHDNMVRVSALDPGVPFIEKLGASGAITIQLPASYSSQQLNKWNKLLAPGMALITNSNQPFAALLEKLQKPAQGRPPGRTLSKEVFERKYRQAYIALIEAEVDSKRPSQTAVAEKMALTLKTFTRHLEDYQLPWSPDDTPDFDLE